MAPAVIPRASLLHCCSCCIKVKLALDLYREGRSSCGAAARGTPAPTPSIDTAKVALIAGPPGETNGAVYKITVGRDDLKLPEMGHPSTPDWGRPGQSSDERSSRSSMFLRRSECAVRPLPDRNQEDGLLFPRKFDSHDG